MSGKFGDEQTERVYEASLDGGCEEVGDVQFGSGHYVKVLDFEGADWIVHEDSMGFVDATSYALDGGLDETGSAIPHHPVECAWDELLAEEFDAIDDPDEDDEDFEPEPTNPYAGPGGLFDEFRQAERLIGSD